MIGLTFARKILNITTYELGNELNLTRQAITLWENKKNNIPNNQKKKLEVIFQLPFELLQKEINNLDIVCILNHYSNLFENKKITLNDRR